MCTVCVQVLLAPHLGYALLYLQLSQPLQHNRLQHHAVLAQVCLVLTITLLEKLFIVDQFIGEGECVQVERCCLVVILNSNDFVVQHCPVFIDEFRDHSR